MQPAPKLLQAGATPAWRGPTGATVYTKHTTMQNAPLQISARCTPRLLAVVLAPVLGAGMPQLRRACARCRHGAHVALDGLELASAPQRRKPVLDGQLMWGDDHRRNLVLVQGCGRGDDLHLGLRARSAEVVLRPALDKGRVLWLVLELKGRLRPRHGLPHLLLHLHGQRVRRLRLWASSPPDCSGDGWLLVAVHQGLLEVGGNAEVALRPALDRARSLWLVLEL